MGRRWLLVCCALAGCPHGRTRVRAPTAAELCPAEVCPELVDQPPAEKRGEQPYAITISGGVSLGAYEAGLNWTVLELLRNAQDHEADLEGVTGASAGSINSLLTSIRWCQSADLEKDVLDVEHNLFSDAWRDIGFDELMPDDPADYANRDDPTAYGADLIMSRKKAFARILATVRALLTAGRGFRPCDVKLGMTVTSRDPKSLVVSDLHVENQRYVIPLRVRSDGTSIEFYVDTRIQDSARKDLLGNLLFLAPDHVISDPDDPKNPKKRRFVVDAPKVLRAALASSAFPGAFGPIELRHCVAPGPPRNQEETAEQRNKRVCSGGRVAPSAKCEALGKALDMDGTAVQCSQKFIDGGVFDNIPLGVAMAQLESELEPIPSKEAPRRPLRYLYIYYNNRRGVPPRDPPRRKADADAAGGPLGDTLAAVSGIISTAQEYELHNVLRYNRWNAGTSKQAYAIADLLHAAASAPATRTTADVASAADKADELFERLKTFAPGKKDDPANEDVADRLRDLAWALEQFSLSGAEFITVQDKVLTSLAALCQKAIDHCPREAIADLQKDVRNNRELVLTRRFSPLTGMHVGHFGAFFDRAFRDYDYYAGVYDGLVNEAFRRCEAEIRAPLNEAEQSVVQQSIAQDGRAANAPAPLPPPPPRDDEVEKKSCPYRQFIAARRRLGITAGPAFEVTQRLWAVEHGVRPIRYPQGRVGQVMKALFSAERCDQDAGETLTDNGYCVHDLGLEPFLLRLKDMHYEPQSVFLAWATQNPSRWWMLPAAHGAERATELARDENNGGIGFAAALAASYVEIGVDEGNDDFWVAPSSLPRRLGLVPRSLFPFFALSMHPTRRFELGLVRGGIRPNRFFDLLFDLSTRVTVRPREPEEEDNGYGLFTRGAVVPHLSGSLVLRIPSPLVSSMALRSGVPVAPFNIGPPSFTLEEQVNAELDFVFLGDKLRFAVGCNPLAPEPNQDCWRDLYYTFGVNDLAGLAYWTGLNPFKVDRLAIPFIAPRLPFRPGLWEDGVAVETGLLRAGYQPFALLGLWADTSIVAGDESTWNGSLALEMRPLAGWRRTRQVVHSIGVRGGFPLTIRENARAKDGNLELVLVLAPPLHLRLAAGFFPGRDQGEDGPLEHPYFSIGFDPGSIPVWLFRELAGGAPD
ncbi:MAG TPA: patatin-like phospholipase family protein [Kofleriaceae bacterium]